MPFQSTLPVGGATVGASDAKVRLEFQSTLPVGGATSIIDNLTAQRNAFQSTLPVGGATIICSVDIFSGVISIHAPRGGSDSKDVQIVRSSLSIINQLSNIFWKNFASEPLFMKRAAVFFSKISANLPGKPCLLALRS